VCIVQTKTCAGRWVAIFGLNLILSCKQQRQRREARGSASLSTADTSSACLHDR
jgi:hypothetical protein